MSFGRSTAYYRHKKDPVQVTKGDIVTYTIRIYNEGYVDGVVKEIKDYLPDGLELAKNSQVNDNYGWKSDTNNTQIIRCEPKNENNIIPSNHSSVGILDVAAGGNSIYKEYEIECKVKENGNKNGQPLLNIAEITNYGYMNDNTYIQASEQDKDIDSEQDNVFSSNDLSNLDVLINDHYNQRLLKRIYPDEGDKTKVYYPGKQDDDDFECVITQPFDLALRKFISEVDGNTITESREPVINTNSLKQLKDNGTAYYYHKKNPVTVQNGKSVTYTIRVYNEGDIEGYAEEITDILPTGLVLDENGTNTKEYNWSIQETKEGQTYVTTNALQSQGIPAFNNETISYKEVKIDCKVQSNDNDKILVNVAEITRYGYKVNNELIEANKPYIDRDSKQNNVFTKTSYIRNIDNYLDYESLEDIHHNVGDTQLYQGFEDDDDFESVKVKSITGSYALKIKKVDLEGNAISGVKFTVNGTETNATNASGLTTVKDKVNITAANVNKEDSYEISEINLGDNANKYVPLKEKVIVKVTKKLENGKYVLSDAKFADGTTEKDITIGGKTAKITVKKTNNVVTVTIPNGEIDGAYALKIKKVDFRGNAISGVKFTVNGTETKETDENGLTTVNDKVDITPEDIEKEDSYEISEINLGDNANKYVPLKEKVIVKVTKEIKDGRYVASDAKFADGTKEKNVTIGGTTSKITVDFKNNVVTVTIPNGEFDLALRKFITAVRKGVGSKAETKEEITSRIPVFEIDEQGNYKYNHTKEPVAVASQNVVEYTLRVYNEGTINGYAKQIKDDIPDGLEFLPDDEVNKEFGWKMQDAEGNVVEDVSKVKYIVTDYLSKEKETTEGENLLKPFDANAYNAGTIKEPEYKEVKVAFKVIIPNSDERIIVNQAQISDDSDGDGNDIEDKDSTPDKWIEGEDDQDIEKIKVQEFDLALRKFITGLRTGVGTKEEKKQDITSRIPVFKVDENGKYLYEHTKEPVVLGNQNIVEYTLRVYNEGQVAGYAKEIKDDIPEGLEFLPDDEVNKEYGWKLVDEEGNVVEDVNKAKYIVTDYLSKEKETTEGENLLKPFDVNAYNAGTIKEPEYKEVKVAFKVTIPNSDNRIIINQAQISDDSDGDGNDVVDKDSTPDKWIEGEDDQDIEKIKVLEFDLALRKWVTKAIVIENGKQTVRETGHKAEDDPEDIVKIDLKKSAIKNVVVKYEYQIRVTNEGEIAGYAKEISDYIPEGLRFEAADNPQWKEVEGKVVTDQLKDTLLQPGESAEVTIILTWINREDNMGLKVNVAEISKDYNEYGTPDRDSTPNNQAPGEDDIDDAPVMLTVKTGQTLLNIGTTVIAINILCAGIVLIKKFVLK